MEPPASRDPFFVLVSAANRTVDWEEALPMASASGLREAEEGAEEGADDDIKGLNRAVGLQRLRGTHFCNGSQ